MKSYFKLYAYTYAIVSLLVFMLALVIIRIYDVSLSIRSLFWGSIIISLLLALSFKVFKKTWGNGVFNVIIGYLIILPITYILRTMYGEVFFRRTFVIYLLGLIYAIIYSLVILYGSVKNKKMESKLNELLKDKTDQKEE